MGEELEQMNIADLPETASGQQVEASPKKRRGKRHNGAVIEEQPNTIFTVAARLWEVANTLRANSNLKASEYATPVLGLIFLRYTDYRFEQARQQLASEGNADPDEFEIKTRTIYLPPKSRFGYLLALPEDSNIGAAINEAMKAIEEQDTELKGALPRNYTSLGLSRSALVDLLKAFDKIPTDIGGDVFGRIYEYFLGKFAMAEGQKGGEFFTPESLVRLIVEVIEPYHGLVLDPACGSGGMFVQSAEFVRRHNQNPDRNLSLYGQERVRDTIDLCKMNLAVHGLNGDIREANSYYDDPHKAVGRFDFVLANPPFNIKSVDKEKIKADSRRYPMGMPTANNGNYLWMQLFYSALNSKGRAGFVMASSASDTGGSALAIRQRLVEAQVVDVMVAIGPQFFFTVSLPCMLWFLDKAKQQTTRADKLLFIDARDTYRQVDRVHREFTPAQTEFLANIVRLYRGQQPETTQGSAELMQQHFPTGEYADVLKLCKVATVKEVEAQGWSLNPGRYVGVAVREYGSQSFVEQFAKLNAELATLNLQAHELEQRISRNAVALLEVSK